MDRWTGCFHPIPWHPQRNTRLLTKPGDNFTFMYVVRSFPKLCGGIILTGNNTNTENIDKKKQISIFNIEKSRNREIEKSKYIFLNINQTRVYYMFFDFDHCARTYGHTYYAPHPGSPRSGPSARYICTCGNPFAFSKTGRTQCGGGVPLISKVERKGEKEDTDKRTRMY